MLILGIETSCDETAISLIEVKNQIEILSNVVASQVKLHAQYGGVYPFLAKREHQKNLPIVLKKATKNIDISKINLIGVTVGPGLEPCLWQGVNFAKDLSKKLKKPIVPVNHIEAHILISFTSVLFHDREITRSFFPAICLVVSGGHTLLVLMKKIGKYKLIGETRDDAAGECFDKTARILGLGYPGGPAIAKLVGEGFPIPNSKLEIKLPRPMLYIEDYDFSFSGLKTAVLYDFRKRPPKMRKSKKYIYEMAKEIQQAIIDVLIHKTLKAAKNFKVKSIILGGGVVANEELRKQFSSIINSQLSNVRLFFPPKNLCTDNAAMVALTAFFHKKEATKDLEKIRVNANLRI